MSAWLTPALPVASALLGVLAGNWSASRRDTRSRLWDKRAETYLDVIKWTLGVEREVEDGSGGVRELPPRDYAGLQIPDELVARIWTFGSQPVHLAYQDYKDKFTYLALSADETGRELGIDSQQALIGLNTALTKLHSVIRRELSGGKLRQPVTFRLSQSFHPIHPIYYIRAKKREFRGRRQLRQILKDVKKGKTR